jgi:hypothetical protein
VSIALVVSLIMIGIGMGSSAHVEGYIFPAEWTENALRAGPLPDPVSMEDTLTTAGSFFGLAAGVAWIASRGGYQASGPAGMRLLRYLIGLIGIIILWFGLGEVFPRGETWIPLVLRSIRYALWVFG